MGVAEDANEIRRILNQGSLDDVKQSIQDNGCATIIHLDWANRNKASTDTTIQEKIQYILRFAGANR